MLKHNGYLSFDWNSWNSIMEFMEFLKVGNWTICNISIVFNVLLKHILTTVIDKTQINYSILYSVFLSIYYSLTMALYVIDKSTYHLLCYIILPLKEGSSHWHSGHGAGWWHFTQWLIWFYRFSVGFRSRESAGDSIWDTPTFSWTF